MLRDELIANFSAELSRLDALLASKNTSIVKEFDALLVQGKMDNAYSEHDVVQWQNHESLEHVFYDYNSERVMEVIGALNDIADEHGLENHCFSVCKKMYSGFSAQYSDDKREILFQRSDAEAQKEYNYSLDGSKREWAMIRRQMRAENAFANLEDDPNIKPPYEISGSSEGEDVDKLR